MKLLSFENSNGVASYGVVLEKGIYDLGARMLDDYPDLKALISNLSQEEILAMVPDNAQTDFDLEDTRFLPVIPNPEKIICVGLNYEEHRKETGRPKADHPAIFVRFSNSQIGHDQQIWLPSVSDVLDYEGELAVVIGKGGRYIKKEDAFNHIAGYACYNDASVRDWQHHTHQFTPGKNFPHTGVFGPWMVTSDEITNLEEQTLTTRLNGEVMQHAAFSSMIFSIPEIIAYVSSFTRLEAGDVIATGTPGGVGIKRDPVVKMKVNDVIEVEITQVGKIRNTIAKEPRS